MRIGKELMELLISRSDSRLECYSNAYIAPHSMATTTKMYVAFVYIIITIYVKYV